MIDSLIGPDRMSNRLFDGVLVELNPALADALEEEVAEEITVDDDDQGEGAER